MSFDLATLDSGVKAQEEGLPMPLLHPKTGEPTGVILRVASYESERVMARARAIGNRVRAERAKQPLKATRVEQDEDTMRALAVAALVGWENLEHDKKPLPYSEANAEMILSKYKFIQDQVEKFGGDRSNFFTT
jgi:hypothetical protein